jgi:hypothetical protein
MAVKPLYEDRISFCEDETTMWDEWESNLREFEKSKDLRRQ